MVTTDVGVVLRAYIGESGTDKPSPWITMSGGVSEKPRWDQIGWRSVLKNGAPRPVREAKASEMEARRRAFKGWKRRDLETFRWRLSEKIDRHVRFGVTLSVARADYERVVIAGLARWRNTHSGHFATRTSG